ADAIAWGSRKQDHSCVLELAALPEGDEIEPRGGPSAARVAAVPAQADAGREPRGPDPLHEPALEVHHLGLRPAGGIVPRDEAHPAEGGIGLDPERARGARRARPDADLDADPDL